MTLQRLEQPVGLAMNSAESAESTESLGRAAVQLNELGMPLPVTEDGKVIGWLTEARLAEAILDGVEPAAPLSSLQLPQPLILRPEETMASALRKLSGDSFALVCDGNQRLLGVIRASDLLAPMHQRPRPNMVGGMATPFGVYLTTGAVSGGVSKWALVATGALMFFLLEAAIVGGQLLMGPLSRVIRSESLSGIAQSVLSIGLFFALLRLAPLSGIHGAEHQVVHAIEREEQLIPAIVRRMPRVHPRCGTNLAAGFSLFLSLFQWEWTQDQELRLLAAAFVTLMLYRWLGAFLQQFITTRRPSDRQLEGGIRAGQQLLEKFLTSGRVTSTPWIRLWNSGLFHVMAGAWAAAGLAYAIKVPLGIPYGL